MKSVFVIDDNGQGMEDARAFLLERGYSITEACPESRDTVQFAQLAVELTHVQIFWITSEGKIIYANDATCNSLGYTREELTRMRVPDIDPLVSSETFEEHWQALRKNGYSYFKTCHRTRDGREYPVEIQANLIELNGKEYACAFAVDISDRKRAEEKLLLYEFCIEKAAIGIFQTSAEGSIAMANEYACRSLGYATDELCGMNIFDIDPAITREKHYKIKEILKDRRSATFETVHKKKDNTTFPVEIAVNRLEFRGKPISFSFAKDITERKMAEKALRDSEKKFRILVETSPNAMVVIQEERIVYANPAIKEISGYSDEELSGREFWNFVHEDFRDKARERGIAFQRSEPIARQHEYRLSTNQGEDRWVLASSVPMEYEGRAAVVVTLVDITEVKQTEEALLESEARLKLAMEIARLVQWEYDVNTGMFRFDDQFYTLYGTSVDREGGMLMSAEDYTRKFVHPDEIPVVGREIERALSSKDERETGHVEHRIIRADGKERYISVRYVAIRDPKGRVVRVRGANQDITDEKRAEEERKILEAQLHQAQKIKAVGQLAGGIAHDFNNILTAIMGFAEIMLIRMETGHPFQHEVKQILASAERAADLTRALLAFSRKQVLHIEALDICDIVDGVKKMLRRLLPEDIDFRVKSAVTAMTVMADKRQIEQVLLNLVTNARDAMSTGGILTIEAESDILDESFVRTHGFGIPGKYARVSVTDTGCGMDKETREKIFEPFFTTKTVGKGTGLGLSIIYGIVKQHKGFITVDSAPEKGTVFCIYLPLVEHDRQRIPEPRIFEPEQGGSETILLAEDDDSVRKLNRITLEKSGYTVIEALDGREALQKFKEPGSHVQILVTDVIMPNMDGKRLYEEIMKIQPDIKVLFISGYTRDFLNARGVLTHAFNFMSKPVMPSELLKKLRKILDDT